MKARSHLLKYLVAVILAAIFPLLYMTRQSFGPSAQASQRHPLDPLSKDEVTATVTVLKDAGKLAPETRFASIYLKEPPKEQVVADLTAGRARRAAYALLYNWTTRVTSEAVVELGQRELVSWKDWEPSDPPARSIIINRLQEIVKADARWQQAARRRGIDDFSRVSILPELGEGQRLREQNGDRFTGAFSFLRDDASAVPAIMGLNMEVNLTRGTMSRFEDARFFPTSPAPARKSTDNPLRPMQILQPDGRGSPLETPRAVAIYERDGGLLWRHGLEARRARKLVLTAYATVDNYDYAFNWIFGQDGTIEVEVMLTGMMNIRNVRDRQEDETAHQGHRMFGHLVAPGVSAPNHQHFFSFRLDFDIDGAQHNSVFELNTETLPTAEGNSKGESFSMTERLLKTEKEAQRMLNLETSRTWKIVSTRARNALGQFSGYALLPGENSVPYATPESRPRQKAGFMNAHLWVTPYSPDEMFASGEFLNLNRSGDGLPKWTSANRSLDDRDIVVWYTLGVTHVPRTEDWPIMPVHSTGFRIVPAGFFSQNPALDVPAQ